LMDRVQNQCQKIGRVANFCEKRRAASLVVW